ncbi:MAG: hypothetical protein L0Y54_16350 [Sporichthyaceae bacterium]|nr:hypothetical protein [Sporichthyaceae bacterium]
MNKMIPLIAALALSAAACSSANDGDTTSPAAAPTGVPFSFQNISLEIPQALDSTAAGTTVPRFDDQEQDAFSPRLDVLDQLIQSLQIAA